MTKSKPNRIVRMPTISAAVVLAAGLVLIATGGTAAVFVGVLFSVAAGVELALDFEQTVVPERIHPSVEPVIVLPDRRATEGEGYEEAVAD